MADSVSDDAVSLSEVIGVMRRHLLLIVIVAVISVAVTVAVGGRLLGGTFTARAVVTLTPLPDNPISGSQPRAVSTTTESSVATSTSVAELAGQSLGWKTSTRDLLAHVSVTSPLDSQILQITFEASSPAQAADGANAFATSYLAYRKRVAESQISSVVTRLQDQISGLSKQQDAAMSRATTGAAIDRAKAETTVRQLGSLIQSLRQQVSTAESSPTDAGQLAGTALAPTAPSGPGRLALGAGGLLLGLLLGVLLAFVRDARDHRVRDARRLEALTGVPTFGTLRHDDTPAGTAEQLRRISAALSDAGISDGHRVVIVAAGRPSAADAPAMLARTMTEAGRSTALLVVGVGALARAQPSEASSPSHVRTTSPAASRTLHSKGPLELVTLGSEKLLPLEVTSPSESLQDLLDNDEGRMLVIDAVNVRQASSTMLLAGLGRRCVAYVDSRQTTADDLVQLQHDLRLVRAQLIGTVLVEAAHRRRGRLWRKGTSHEPDRAAPSHKSGRADSVEVEDAVGADSVEVEDAVRADSVAIEGARTPSAGGVVPTRRAADQRADDSEPAPTGGVNGAARVTESPGRRR